ncbi:hypothetical protein GUJ93_ZPchr0004g39068 [Zizania palustris]|uniref:Uncharacterized protein n=1 Tax=Zizania palustris TaxID=103762 RepID=A0A8J5SR16_ZIZPA|nr:hypothetical protein GUJ93_ZPchr0004g39068 [Zizania palustris]
MWKGRRWKTTTWRHASSGDDVPHNFDFSNTVGQRNRAHVDLLPQLAPRWISLHPSPLVVPHAVGLRVHHISAGPPAFSLRRQIRLSPRRGTGCAELCPCRAVEEPILLASPSSYAITGCVGFFWRGQPLTHARAVLLAPDLLSTCDPLRCDIRRLHTTLAPWQCAASCRRTYCSLDGLLGERNTEGSLADLLAVHLVASPFVVCFQGNCPVRQSLAVWVAWLLNVIVATVMLGKLEILPGSSPLTNSTAGWHVDIHRIYSIYVESDFQVTDVKMICVDRLDFDLHVQSGEDTFSVRIPFSREVSHEE